MDVTLSGTGKELTFTQVYESYAEDIYRLCYSFMKNHMDAEDAVQEVFLKYYRQGKAFESERHLKAWLVVTASNHCKDMLKHWWKKRRSMEEAGEAVGENDVLVDEMMDIILDLPEKYKTVVYLYYYEGYDSREIAELLHKPGSTVRTYLQKARKLIKQEWM